ncbi:11507_t:CDS:2 [Ambispora gerdemannii]|uniref:11507_t:CDS:1 n=1 Tax=Ambispora gerdemannii TaxID=144530 RepID=A0A9N8WJ16_9GLOM|nr:11507_t:CDS:2 [Ambispora gerdemannii]
MPRPAFMCIILPACDGEHFPKTAVHELEVFLEVVLSKLGHPMNPTATQDRQLDISITQDILFSSQRFGTSFSIDTYISPSCMISEAIEKGREFAQENLGSPTVSMAHSPRVNIISIEIRNPGLGPTRVDSLMKVDY